jgi:UDP-2,3-diacylglucosamine pyrophosphatase LpxH
MKRVIISDTHIGSLFYKSEELFKFLKEVEYDQLILAGDIIDFIKIPVFTERCMDILQAIDRDKEVIYIVGNHDESLVRLVGKNILGIDFVKRYEFEENNRKFRVEHGDSYDAKSFINTTLFVKLLSVIQNVLEVTFDFDFTTWWTERQIKRHKLRNIVNILRLNDDVDTFIMGHLHIPEVLIWIQANQTIKTYVNCGDWISNQTYVEIEDGVARLKEFKSIRA